jgi:hypothetical protein
MDDTILKSGWETILVAIVFLGLLIVGVFRLDAIFAARRREPKRSRPAIGKDKDGAPLYSDPDGKAWRNRQARK